MTCLHVGLARVLTEARVLSRRMNRMLMFVPVALTTKEGTAKVSNLFRILQIYNNQLYLQLFGYDACFML
jgi:hypothetical protein